MSAHTTTTLRPLITKCLPLCCVAHFKLGLVQSGSRVKGKVLAAITLMPTFFIADAALRSPSDRTTCWTSNWVYFPLLLLSESETGLLPSKLNNHKCSLLSLLKKSKNTKNNYLLYFLHHRALQIIRHTLIEWSIFKFFPYVSRIGLQGDRMVAYIEKPHCLRPLTQTIVCSQ